MPSRNETISLLKRYHLRPLKRLGQNFLIDDNIRDKIIGSVDPKRGDVIVEIGPGLAALTLELALRAGRVIAVERDRGLYNILLETIGAKASNLELINDDILKVDLSEFAPSGKIKLAGNLPYYITTPIFEYLIDNRRLIERAVITIQREVADRILAAPGGKDYGALSCFIQYYTRPQYLYTISRGCFYPKPEVDSSLILLDMLDSPAVEVKDEKLFFRIIRKAFNQRRKTISNSLASKAFGRVASKEDLAAALARARIDPSSRPETLSLQSFAALTNIIKVKGDVPLLGTLQHKIQ